MKYSYWLIYNSCYDKITKPFITEVAMNNFIEKYKSDLEVIARTKVLESRLDKWNL